MPDDAAQAKPPISLEEIRATALAVAAERDLPGMTRRLGVVIQSWAAPSAVVCLRRDPAAEGGWRVLPELTSGQVSPGFGRSFARLVDGAEPESLTRPALVRPAEEYAGLNVKPRDNWVVPWSWGEASGFVLLRGISRPYPPNLGEAVALVSQPLWPLVCERLELARRVGELAAEVRHAAERLGGEGRQAPAPGPETETPPGQLSALREKAEALETARAQTEAARDRAESEAAELRDQVEALERQAEADRQRLAELEEAGRATAALRERLAALESERAAAEAERDRAKVEAKAARKDRDRDALRLIDMEEARRQSVVLQERIEALERARAQAETERERAKAEANTLWRSVDSLQRQIQSEKARFEAEKASLEEACRAAERRAEEAGPLKETAETERDAAWAAASAAEEKARQAEERARGLEERWERSAGALRAAVEALRRTPFVPPTLRVTMAAIEGFLESAQRKAEREAASGRPRILLLDRDTPTLDTLAAEMEEVGLDVLIAHYPEEVGFFLKTPESRSVSALICDVMAFRADRDLRDLVRAWHQEMPGLAVLLSFRADHPTEAERAKLIPVSVLAGYLPRPLQKDAILDAVAKLPPSSRGGPEKGR